MIHGGSRLFLLRHFHPKKMLAKMNSNLNSMFRVRKSHQIGLKAPSLLIFTSPKKWEHLEFIGPFFQMLGEQSTKLHPRSPKTSGRKTWDFQPLLRRKTHLPSTSMFRFKMLVSGVVRILILTHQLIHIYISRWPKYVFHQLVFMLCSIISTFTIILSWGFGEWLGSTLAPLVPWWSLVVDHDHFGAHP